MNDDKNNTDLLTDLMWSDPTNSCELFLPSNRGSGCYFGYVITNHFLKKNGMKMIVRGHESVKRGIEKNHEKKVVTIYSSSSLRQGVLAGCAIFDTDDSFTEFRLIPISTVQRSEAKFFSPKAKQNNNNKPLKLNSFSRSQSIFGNVKKLRKNMKGSYHQSVNSSPDYNGNMIPDICTIKEEEGECLWFIFKFIKSEKIYKIKQIEWNKSFFFFFFILIKSFKSSRIVDQKHSKSELMLLIINII